MPPDLKSPNKGGDIIFNTLPFPGHISRDSEVSLSLSATKSNITFKCLTHHLSKQNILPVQTQHWDSLPLLAGIN